MVDGLNGARFRSRGRAGCPGTVGRVEKTVGAAQRCRHRAVVFIGDLPHKIHEAELLVGIYLTPGSLTLGVGEGGRVACIHNSRPPHGKKPD